MENANTNAQNVGLNEELKTGETDRSDGLSISSARGMEKSASQEDIDAEEPGISGITPEVLTPDDVKDLAPYYSNVVLAIRQVYDPEIPVNVYDLGLIYELNINKAHEVYIKMTFTSPTCPMADDVIMEVKAAVEDVPGIKKCDIELVFEPVWDKSMLSDEARLELGLDDE